MAADGDDGGAVGHLGFPAFAGDGGNKVAHKPLNVGDFGVEVDLDFGIVGHPLHQVIHIGLHRFAVPGMVELQGMAAQEVLFLHQGHVVALAGQAQGGLHAGHPAADHQTGLGDGQVEFLQRRLQGHGGHGHAHLVFGPLGGRFRFVLVHPGALVPDVGHLKEVLVEAGFLDGLLEEWVHGCGAYRRPPRPG